MKIGVIYARYSSDKQTEQSIEGQVRVCKEYAKNNNIVIANTYIDRAMSGRFDDRDAFQQMITDSKEKLWNCVLVYKFDRFSRNIYESELYKHKLNENGVDLLSATEQIPYGPEGTLLKSLILGMNQYYSEELAQKTTRGLKEVLFKGKFLGKEAPLGYREVDRKLEIDESEAEVVKMIFNEYVNGLTTGQIANKLNKMGLTKRGKPFYDWSIRRILSSKFYTGKYELFNKTFNNIYPKIIDNKLFEIVKKELKKNALGRNSLQDVYLLRHKVFCGICNNEYTSYLALNPNSNLRYYKCKANHPKKICPSHTVKKEVLEDIVITTIKKLFNEKNKDKIIEKIILLHNGKFNDKEKIKFYEERLAQIDKSINNILDAMEKGVFSKFTQQKLDKLDKEQRQISKSLDLIKKDKNAIKKYADKIKEYYLKTIDKEPIFMLTFLLQKVVVFDDKIEIYISSPDDLNDIGFYKKLTAFTESRKIKTNIGRNHFIYKPFERQIIVYV